MSVAESNLISSDYLLNKRNNSLPTTTTTTAICVITLEIVPWSKNKKIEMNLTCSTGVWISKRFGHD